MRAFFGIRLVLAGLALIGSMGCTTVRPSVGGRSIVDREWPAAHRDFDHASRRGYDPSRAFGL